MKNEALSAADLYAGAGGTSTGLVLAARILGRKVDLTAVNHWKTAIRTHEANYPWAKHLQADVEAVNPLEAIPTGHLDILVASPECIHHSRAAGGRPKNEQKRASAWAIFRWLEFLRVDSVLVENVPEFATWGPLDAQNRPVKLRRGEIYRAWLEAFRAHGYTVETKVLNAANFGAPTSRSRLFIAAILGKKRPTWPVPTHSKEGWPVKKWRSAREIIDWSIKGTSIFNRKKPLSPRTIQRITEGLRRFGGRELQPFIILMEHGGGIRNIDEPLPTITTAKGGAMALANPEYPEYLESFILSQGSTGAPRTTKDPMPTIVAKGAHALVEPFLLPVEGFFHKEGQNKAKSLNKPLGAITQRGGGNLVEPFLIKYNGTGGAKSVEQPLDTISTKDRFGLAEPQVRNINDPLPDMMDHFALVQPEIDGCALDIRFRMLQPHELASATGFPTGYKFLGTKTDIVRQIGNAVVVDIAKALCLSLLSTKRRKQNARTEN